MGGAGVIYEKEEEQDSVTNLHHSRNKIYNVKSPRSKHQQRSKNMPMNTEGIAEEEAWQSNAQLPMLVIDSQQRDKNKTVIPQPMNIIITNSTFNYKSHH